MQKSQKIWLWVFLIMFFVPEIFFSFLPTFFAFMLGYSEFPSIISEILTDNFLESNTIFVDLFLGIEYLGLLGLFIWNIKFNNHKIYKWTVAILSGLILIILSLIVLLVYSVSNMSFP